MLMPTSLRTLAWMLRSDESGHVTGVNWLFTPVKPSYAVDRIDGIPSRWFAEVWQNHYLDLRVVVANVAMGLLLLVALPVLTERLSGAVASAIYALGIFYIVFLGVVFPITQYYSGGWISLSVPGLLVVLALAGRRMLKRRQRSASSA